VPAFSNFPWWKNCAQAFDAKTTSHEWQRREAEQMLIAWHQGSWPRPRVSADLPRREGKAKDDGPRVSN